MFTKSFEMYYTVPVVLLPVYSSYVNNSKTKMETHLNKLGFGDIIIRNVKVNPVEEIIVGKFIGLKCCLLTFFLQSKFTV